MKKVPIIMLGAAGVGMLVATINPIYAVEKIGRRMLNSEPVVIVTIPQLNNTKFDKVAILCPIHRLLFISCVLLKDCFSDVPVLC